MNRTIFQICNDADAAIQSGPHGWIQWKGTSVCMDLRCSCGESSHLDADFAYAVRCPHCNRVWAVCSTVKLLAVSAEQEKEFGSICDAVADIF